MPETKPPVTVAVPLLPTTLAIVPSLLLHVPPVVVLLSVILEPEQTVAVPVIPLGMGLTVVRSVEKHPLVLV